MWKFFQANKDGQPVNFEPFIIEDQVKYAMSVTSSPQIFGVFKATSVTLASTTVISIPSNGGAIVLTDLILTAKKKAGGSLTIQFSDGTNTETIAVMDVNANPGTLGMPFVGKWEGWRDARLELVTNADIVATAAVGYYKIQKGREFSAWDALR